jgi:hopanoid biosynthesis associated protein HpnK
VRRLIINADDFGLTSGVNRAIVEAHRAGTVTSATLMAGGRRFDDAIAAAHSCPSLGVGCHVVLIDGQPLKSPADVSSLVENIAQSEPRFRDSLAVFAGSALTGRIDPGDIEAEAVAQIRKLQSAGLEVSHLDTHKHAHVFPAVLKPLLSAARKCGIRAIRNPFVPGRRARSRDIRRWQTLGKRYVQVEVLRALWGRGFRAAVESAGLLTTDGSFGVVETGYMDSELLNAVLTAIPEGTWELVCHPGYEDDELGSIRTRLRRSRVEELQLFKSPSTRDLLADHGIELISFKQLS